MDSFKQWKDERALFYNQREEVRKKHYTSVDWDKMDRMIQDASADLMPVIKEFDSLYPANRTFYVVGNYPPHISVEIAFIRQGKAGVEDMLAQLGGMIAPACEKHKLRVKIYKSICPGWQCSYTYTFYIRDWPMLEDSHVQV